MKLLQRQSRQCLLCLLLPLGLVQSRSWKDIVTYHTPGRVADAVDGWKIESDPLLFTASPTNAPSFEPTMKPTTGMPTSNPTARPTVTQTPTAFAPTTTSPTPSPSASPSISPTLNPTNEPTSDPFPENEVPLFPPASYFNYDTDTSAEHGPGYPALVRSPDGRFKVEYQNNGWTRWQAEQDDYWKEFTAAGFGAWRSTLEPRNMEVNRCEVNSGQQSPIDVRMSGVACVEHHQIRSRRGDHGIRGAGVDRQIQSNKLRLLYKRRPCGDLFDPACFEPDPPHADFPNGWGGFADVVHVDFKIPAEHRINGEIFDAEMQIFHLHAGRRRLPAVSVVIRAGQDTHNAYFQAAIDAFQYEYDLHKAQCAETMRNNRSLLSTLRATLGDVRNNQTSEEDWWTSYSTQLDDPEFLEQRKMHDRRLNSNIWSPYHEDVMPSYYFYGYDGSLTEPPCTEIVTWFIMDNPMLISFAQLQQLKTILFTHVDEDCRRTSVHSDQSVARPIQESAGRDVWRCTEEHYLPDHLRGD